MIFPRWRQSLVRSLHLQRSKPEAKFFQVANAYMSKLEDSAPIIEVENRTMVFRGFAEQSNTLLAITDARSDKVEQWRAQASAQICWYFTKTREQYRISVKITVVGKDQNSIIGAHPDESLKAELYNLRANIWSQLSPKAKEQFLWPHPKQAVSDIKTEMTPPEDIPDNFLLVCFMPHFVDYLRLGSSGQTRELHHKSDDKWSYEAVNP